MTTLKLLNGDQAAEPLSLFTHRPYPRIVCRCGWHVAVGEQDWVFRSNEHADQFKHVCSYVPPLVTPEDAMR